MNAHKDINVTLIILYIKLTSTKENDVKDKAYLSMTSLNWKFRYHIHLQPFKNPT